MRQARRRRDPIRELSIGWVPIAAAAAVVVAIVLILWFAAGSGPAPGVSSALGSGLNAAAASTTTSDTAGPAAVVTVANLNVRSTPDTSRPPVALIPAGGSPSAHCWVTGQSINGQERWIKVTWAAVDGYVSSYYTDLRTMSAKQIEQHWGLPPC